MNLSDYIQLPREQRIAHIDLTTDCILVKPGRRRKARRDLLKHLGITEQTLGRGVQCCHLCENHTGANSLCINPLHLYMGTISENAHDKPVEVRVASAKTARASQPPLTEEQRRLKSITSRNVWGKTTAEERAEILRRSNQTAKQNDPEYNEKRKQLALQYNETLTAEQRSERTRKGWETRRRKQQGG